MKIKEFFDVLQRRGIEFYAGVPDSQLKAMCDYLQQNFSQPYQHVIAHNEGGAVALAAGHYLATGRVPCVYMQNSGIGNAVNPVCSLTNPKVYGIPMLFVIGWRGEPGVHDEPQHIFQGEVTLPLLNCLGIDYCIVDQASACSDISAAMERFQLAFSEGKSTAFIIKKGALEGEKAVYKNAYHFNREEAVECITTMLPDAAFVSTTGKISRELFEIRERRGQGHAQDFLTVGSMGHSAMIALGVALAQPTRRVVCIDGDGAMLMHMGSLAVTAGAAPQNLIHIVLNNEAHETVGGMSTAAVSADLAGVAQHCGYRSAYCVKERHSLCDVLEKIRSIRDLVFIEVKVALGSRADLGRPTSSARENGIHFHNYLTRGGEQR